MAESLHVDDGLWAVLEPLLPAPVSMRIGRPRVDDRIAFTAILFVLVTGVPWRVLPREMGCSGVTAWRRHRRESKQFAKRAPQSGRWSSSLPRPIAVLAASCNQRG